MASVFFSFFPQNFYFRLFWKFFFKIFIFWLLLFYYYLFVREFAPKDLGGGYTWHYSPTENNVHYFPSETGYICSEISDGIRRNQNRFFLFSWVILRRLTVSSNECVFSEDIQSRRVDFEIFLDFEIFSGLEKFWITLKKSSPVGGIWRAEQKMSSEHMLYLCWLRS